MTRLGASSRSSEARISRTLLAAAVARPRGEPLGQRLARQLLDQAVPAAAIVAAAGPFGMNGSALLTSVTGLVPRHRFNPAWSGPSCRTDLHLDRPLGTAVDELI